MGQGQKIDFVASGLSNIIEQALFNVERLRDLKKLGITLGIRSERVGEFMEALLRYLNDSLTSLTEDLPFILKNLRSSQTIQDYADTPDNSSKSPPPSDSMVLKDEIQKRNELLVEIRDRVRSIRDALL